MSTPAIRAILVSPYPCGPLALALLVLRDLADHPQHPVAADELALFAARLDRRSYLHVPSPPGVPGERSAPPACRSTICVRSGALECGPCSDEPPQRAPNSYGSILRYLKRYVMRPRVRSYGESSTRTRSPGRI